MTKWTLLIKLGGSAEKKPKKIRCLYPALVRVRIGRKYSTEMSHAVLFLRLIKQTSGVNVM